MGEKELPTIEEMSGSINFGGRVVFDEDGEQWVLSEEQLRERLEQEVIKTAKVDRLTAKAGTGSNVDSDLLIVSRSALTAAIDALLKFESESR